MQQADTRLGLINILIPIMKIQINQSALKNENHEADTTAPGRPR